MNLLKLNKRQTIFCVIVVIVTSIIGVILLRVNNDLRYIIQILIVLTAFISAWLSKVIFPESKN